MDCQKAATAMMHYAEKSLKPTDARDLATHLMSCAPCRDVYVLMDESTDLLAETAQVDVPLDFTAQVMARIQEETKKEVTVSAVHSGVNGLRMLWGLSGIVAGIALLIAFNLQWVSIAIAQDMLVTVITFASDTIERIGTTQVTETFLNSSMGILALIFAMVIGALLYGLHRGENTTQGHFHA